ncbi:MAG: STAS domain-containing protein [Planctomycetota bacterium]
MTTSKLSVEDYAGVTLVKFAESSILETAVIEQLGRDLCHLIDAEHKRKLVLDFSNVKFLSSHALGILLTLHRKAAETKGAIVLCGMRSELKKVFTITSLDKVFKFCRDDAEALASFGVRVD